MSKEQNVHSGSVQPALQQADCYGHVPFKHASLFSGIGGFDLAAEWMGWENIFHCEINEFCQKILNYYWPNAKSYDDIKKTDFTIWRGKLDIITGGFPCQPYSQAGLRKGKEDDRHLWPEMLRAIREVQPTWIVGENVSGLLNWNGGLVLNEIKTDLETSGFEVFPPLVLPACAINAPHRRDRVWIVAHSASNGHERRISNSEGNDSREQNSEGIRQRLFNKISSISEGRIAAYPDNWSRPQDTIQTGGQEFNELHAAQSNATNTNGTGWEELNDAAITDNQEGVSGSNDALHTNGTIKQGEHIGQEREGEFDGPDCGDGINRWENFPTKSPICSRDDGLSYKLDGITFPKWRNESIKGYGNAVVPQVVFEIFKALESVHRHCP